MSVLQEWSAQSQDVYISPEGMVKDSIKTQPGDTTFVFLQDAQPNESKSEILKRHDAYMATSTKDLSAQFPNMLFIYTAKHKNDVHVRHVREAADTKPAVADPAVPATNASKPVEVPAAHPQAPPAHRQTDPNEPVLPEQEVFFNRHQLIIYFYNLTQGENLINTNEILITPIQDEKKFTVALGTGAQIFAFNVSGESEGYWNLDEYQFGGSEIYLQQTQVAALSNFSYHCTPALTFLDNKGLSLELHWNGLQIEPYFGEDTTHVFEGFSDSWDCVGFTSAGIWGGLFVTLLFLIILSIGFSWMMDIRTMDRFDDPKGKTIIISATD